MKHLFILLIFVFCSCGQTKNNTDQIDFSNAEELSEESNTSYDEIISWDKGRSRDVVDHLYNEAMKNDPTLEKLNEKIEDMFSIKSDSLQKYSEFKSYNELFYSSAEHYTDRIQDSTKRKTVEGLFAKSQEDYLKKVDRHNISFNSSLALENKLDEQLILMKLVIAEGLIKKYQENIPSKDQIDHLNEMYERLIQEAEKYSKIK